MSSATHDAGPAEEVRQDLAARLRDLRNSVHGTEELIVKVAGAYLDARTEMSRLRHERALELAADVRTVTGLLFSSTDPSVRADPMSARDATDRVNRLPDGAAALQAFHQAEENGDRMLSRRIVIRALRVRLGLDEADWSQILAEYVEKRPATETRLSDAFDDVESGGLRERIAEIFLFSLPTPAELAGCSLSRMRKIAELA